MSCAKRICCRVVLVAVALDKIAQLRVRGGRPVAMREIKMKKRTVLLLGAMAPLVTLAASEEAED